LNPGKTKAFMVAFVLLLTGLMTAGVAYATALAPNNALTMEGPGLTIAEGGVGLQGLTQATINHNNDPSNPLPEISVTIGGRWRKLFSTGPDARGPAIKLDQPVELPPPHTGTRNWSSMVILSRVKLLVRNRNSAPMAPAARTSITWATGLT
jgi:hypothetical protein